MIINQSTGYDKLLNHSLNEEARVRAGLAVSVDIAEGRKCMDGMQKP